MKLYTALLSATFAVVSKAAEVSTEVSIEAESHPLPVPDFDTAVKEFDFCENVIVQSDYEDYINEAANILIALEAFR